MHSPSKGREGQSRPENKAFYDSVVKTLDGAHEILVFGSGSGGSRAMETLLQHLKRNHANVSSQVIGSVVVDTSHMSEDQLLAKAREFYSET